MRVAQKDVHDAMIRGGGAERRTGKDPHDHVVLVDHVDHLIAHRSIPGPRRTTLFGTVMKRAVAMCVEETSFLASHISTYLGDRGPRSAQNLGEQKGEVTGKGPGGAGPAANPLR